MGELEVGQSYQWIASRNIFKIMEIKDNSYIYCYVVGNQTGCEFSNYFTEHEDYIKRGRIFRLTPLIEALL